MITYASGAQRVEKKPYYRSIPFSFLRRLGEALKDGAKYDNEVPGTDSQETPNWKKGDAHFFAECFDHAIEHMFLHVHGDRSEDHIAHAAANLCFIAEAQERGIWDPSYKDYPPITEEPEPEPIEEEEEIDVVTAPTLGWFQRTFRTTNE